MLLLLIVPIWAILLLLVAGLCRGARIGDAVEQRPGRCIGPAPRGRSQEQRPQRRRFAAAGSGSAARERSLHRPAA